MLSSRIITLLALCFSFALSGVLTQNALAASDQQPWMDSSKSASLRADALIKQMTLTEKLTMLHGAPGSPYVGHIPANKRLGIPALNLEDGPAGVADGLKGATQLPAPVAAAASWDRRLMHHYGSILGAEELGKGANVNLAPTINIVRDPRWGRAFETLGEDPYLEAQLGVADIKGIQSTGALAQAKHWAIYNQETNRNTTNDDVLVNRRAMHEIYMPAFKAAIKQGHVASFMCSYNVLHGKFACENPYILTQVLRDQWKFKGFVTSDWGATHSTLASAKAGLDMEMPDNKYFGDPLKAAIQTGKVSKKAINAKVRHILLEMFRFGLFDHPNKGSVDAKVTSPAHARFARQAEEQGTVLLKNERNTLPFSKKIKSIAIIGNDAGPKAMTGGGGSAHVLAPYVITPYQGIKKRAGKDIRVRYAQGNLGIRGLPIVPSKYLAPSKQSNKHGLKGAYYNNTKLSSSPVLTRTDAKLDFNWKGDSPGKGINEDHWSARWTGTLTPPESGKYAISLNSDDASRLYINDKKIIGNWGANMPLKKTAIIALQKGRHYNIRLDYEQGGGGSSIHLGWNHIGGHSSQRSVKATLIQQAVKLARSADVAVVFANDYESEGSDREDITLPGNQNALISAVAKANKNTIVVLNTGDPVTMPWAEDVSGVIEAWYPGQEDGHAIASVLFGDVNPAGHLPVTFPKSLEQVPANSHKSWIGVDGKIHYSEGLLVGYRWYDQKKIKPLYPFGFGLSYTHFKLKSLKVSPKQVKSQGQVRVSCTITNTGKRAGADVVQVYVGYPASVGEPPRQLKAFKKVHLNAHSHKKVTFKLDSSAFSYWNEDKNAWSVKDGKYEIYVGDSSRHLPLKGKASITSTAK